MSTFKVSDPDGFLYIVADSHLDEDKAPAEEFVEMLVQLENPHTLVFLGDLFKIWLAPPKFWSDLHRQVLLGFKYLKDKGAMWCLLQETERCCCQENSLTAGEKNFHLHI